MEEEKKISKGIWEQMRENEIITVFDVNKYKSMPWAEFLKMMNDAFPQGEKK